MSKLFKSMSIVDNSKNRNLNDSEIWKSPINKLIYNKWNKNIQKKH